MQNNEFTSLRLEVKKLIAGSDLDMPGGRQKLQAALAEKLGRAINIKSITMALTGYRNGPASAELLAALRDILASDLIHNNAMERN